MDESLAIQVVDLAFGDCGKGTIVDYLTRLLPTPQHGTVVRFNGGPQAAHNVVTPDGVHHTFAQFGSGTLAGASTLLTRDVLIDPYALLRESDHLELLGATKSLHRWMPHANCRVITPAHQAANRLRCALDGPDDPGTCGMGVGEVMLDQSEQAGDILLVRSMDKPGVVQSCLRRTFRRKQDEFEGCFDLLADDSRCASAIRILTDPDWIEAAVENYRFCAESFVYAPDGDLSLLFDDPRPLIMEGAQGVLLDQDHGFHPHTTWSSTTFANADDFLSEIGRRRPLRLGVLRSYFTRHGPGPFVTEDATMLADLPELHNRGDGWQGAFRVGSFDAVAAVYAMGVVGGVDALAITHCDRVEKLPPRICVAYDLPRRPGDDELFVRRGDAVVAIRVFKEPDLARQARLTRRLMECKPIFADAPATSADAYLAHLSNLLGTPIAIASHGPTATDKELRLELFSGAHRAC